MIVDDRHPPDILEKSRSAYLLVLAASLVLYIVTCAPGVLWVDSGIFQYRILVNNVVDARGLALSHPLYIFIGILLKALPVGDLAHRINLISAVAAAVTAANIFLLVQLWLGATVPAILSALTLALSWTFWAHSTIAEVYTLSCALFTAELIVLLLYFRDRSLHRLGWLFFLNGLEVANHMLGVIPLAVYSGFLLADVARRRIGPRALLVASGAFAAGCLPYLFIIARDIERTGDLAGTAYSVFFGSEAWRQSVTNISVTPRMALENLLYFAYSFSTPNILLLLPGVAGLWRIQRARSFAGAIAVLAVSFFVFAFRYTVPDRYSFFIPFHIMCAIVLGAGFQWFTRRFSGRAATAALVACALLPIPVYSVAPILARKAGFLLNTKRDLPYRDQYAWFLTPWKTGYTGTRRFAEEALDAVERNSVVFGDGSTAFPLLFVQDTEQLRPDVTIVSWNRLANDNREYSDAQADDYIRTRPFYVVSPVRGYCPDHLLDSYDFKKDGLLWRVERSALEGAATSPPEQ